MTPEKKGGDPPGGGKTDRRDEDRPETVSRSRSIDPRLLQMIEEAGEDGEVEAVVLLDKSAASEAGSDERGVGGAVLDRVVEEVRQAPSEVRYMRRLGAVYVKGKARLLSRLLDEAEVRSASSTEAEFTTGPGSSSDPDSER